jgi:hypothetical protein
MAAIPMLFSWLTEKIIQIRYTERNPKGGIVMPTPEELFAQLAPHVSWYIHRGTPGTWMRHWAACVPKALSMPA